MSKVRKTAVEVVEHMVGGPGYVKRRSLIEDSGDLFGNGRLYAHIVLEKDCGVGYHVHQGDGEIYYVLKGEAEYNDNGRTVTLTAGDVTHTAPGEGHGIVNRREEPVELIALILYDAPKAE